MTPGNLPYSSTMTRLKPMAGSDIGPIEQAAVDCSKQLTRLHLHPLHSTPCAHRHRNECAQGFGAWRRYRLTPRPSRTRRHAPDRSAWQGRHRRRVRGTRALPPALRRSSSAVASCRCAPSSPRRFWTAARSAPGNSASCCCTPTRRSTSVSCARSADMRARSSPKSR